MSMPETAVITTDKS